MDDLEKMKSHGVKAVINLRRPEEYDASSEADTANRLGLRYFLIPVESKHPLDS